MADNSCGGTEFKVFMEKTEQHLWELFRAIDRDDNGELDRAELAEALRSNGITVDSDRLEQFFEQLDKNNDGHITFEEWRCVAFTR